MILMYDTIYIHKLWTSFFDDSEMGYLELIDLVDRSNADNKRRYNAAMWTTDPIIAVQEGTSPNK
jgi:hypothetical protein